MDNCFTIPDLYTLIFAFSLFPLAIFAFWLTFLFSKHFLQKKPLASNLMERLKKGVFALYLEIAAFLFLQWIVFPSYVFHALLILFIVTIGYLSGTVANALYEFGINKYGTQELGEMARRSTLTQIHFIYRLGMVLIVILTLASVLMTFPYIKNVGIGLLSSAGIMGIALGIAARPIFLNLMAGMQIAFNKTLKIGDAIIIEGDYGSVESIQLTHVVIRTWDLRRFVIPTSYFVEKPYQNWSIHSSELLATVILYCDYTVSVDELRKKFVTLLAETSYFNGNMQGLQVINSTEQSVQIRLTMSAKDASSASQLSSFVRENMIAYIQDKYPHALPKQRFVNITN